MKKLIVAVLSICFIPAAFADDWVKVYEDTIATTYVLTTSIKHVSNGKRTMWSMEDIKSGKSFIVKDEYDCHQEKVRTLSFNVYSRNMGAGNLEKSSDTWSNWLNAVPSSIGKAKFDIVCK